MAQSSAGARALENQFGRSRIANGNSQIEGSGSMPCLLDVVARRCSGDGACAEPGGSSTRRHYAPLRHVLQQEVPVPASVSSGCTMPGRAARRSSRAHRGWGRTPHVVMEILGHIRISITVDVYAHVVHGCDL